MEKTDIATCLNKKKQRLKKYQKKIIARPKILNMIMNKFIFF